jgi:hypothetical protein
MVLLDELRWQWQQKGRHFKGRISIRVLAVNDNVIPADDFKAVAETLALW